MSARASEAPVLVVEDDAELRSLYDMLLHREGYEVLTAGNGADGLQLLGRGPGVVLLDLAMPVMDGYEFLRRIRAADPPVTTPVVVISGMADLTRLAGRGVTEIILKPFDATEVLRVVASALR